MQMLRYHVVYSIQVLLLLLTSSGWSNHQPWLATAARPIGSACSAQQDSECALAGLLCVNGSCSRQITPDAGSAASIGCSSSFECRQRRSTTPYCIKGRCVAKCASNADCHGLYAKVCAVDGVCRQQQCTSSGQCKAAAAATPYCLSGSCSKTQCAEDADCTGKAANCVAGRCRRQQCYQDAHCYEKLGQGYTCKNGSCQAEQQTCAQDIDCSSTTAPYCTNSFCQQDQCVANADCSSLNNGTTPFCVLVGSIRVCQACSSDTQCSQSSQVNQYCRNITGQNNKCVGCALDADCANNQQYSGTACDTATGSCVQCTTDQHCDYYAVVPGELTCTGFKCVSNNGSNAVNATKACTVSAQCPRWPYGPQQTCQVNATSLDGYCRECLADSDCPPGLNGVNATCSPSGQCVQCTGSSGCPSTTLDPAVCSAAVGKCVECQTDEHCRFRLSPAKPLICLHGICSYCRTDQDCCGWAGKTGQGPYCDAQGKCNVRGRSCSIDADCVYDVDSRCKCAKEPCPVPRCNLAEGICDSGLQGL